jgi:small subunit ribosomal protein S17
MSENETTENENETTAEAEVSEAVETPEPQAEPASEPEAAAEPADAEADDATAPAPAADEAVEPAAAEAEPEPEPAAEPVAEDAAEPAPGEAAKPAAEETAAPTAPAGEPRKRSRRHVPRGERRQRPKRVRAGEAGTRKPIARLEKPEHERGRRQERRGIVVSDAMDKTIVVKVDAVKAHQRYKKVIRRSVKFHAHDPENQAHVGDRVRIVETRPLSKTKNWRLAEVLEAAK